MIRSTLSGIAAFLGRRTDRHDAQAPSRAPARTVSATERTVQLDPVDGETHEALDRLSSTVRNHDLGDGVGHPRARTREGAARGHGARGSGPDRPDGLGEDPQDLSPPGRLLTGTELDVAPRTELREQVRLVSAHNAKLHKVVIAQQASLESARDSIAHHRKVARHAVEEARTALEHKRIAVKLARRERAERVRLGDEHDRAQAALANAMALLHERDGDGPGAVRIDAAEAEEFGDGRDRYASADRARR